MFELTASTRLAILLTARWAATGCEPLSNRDYYRLLEWLGTDADSAQAVMDRQRSLNDCPIGGQRLTPLLDRGLGVFSLTNRWLNAGVWIRSWTDREYPQRFAQLGDRAPAIVFGFGDPGEFTDQAVAIVGSRNAAPERLEHAAKIGGACARAGVKVVSGGARGVDAIAMEAGLNGGGRVVGIIADSLLKESGKRGNRELLEAGKLCLMSETHPEAGFSVGNAMSRNRLVFACADAAFIVECEPNEGGTWHGAKEAIREHKRVFVLRGAKAEKELADLGVELIDPEFALDPINVLRGTTVQASSPNSGSLMELLLELVGEAPLDTASLAVQLRSDPESIAERLIAAGRNEVRTPVASAQAGSAALARGGRRKQVTATRSASLFEP